VQLDFPEKNIKKAPYHLLKLIPGPPRHLGKNKYRRLYLSKPFGKLDSYSADFY